jgi:hypothetical protein
MRTRESGRNERRYGCWEVGDQDQNKRQWVGITHLRIHFLLSRSLQQIAVQNKFTVQAFIKTRLKQVQASLPSCNSERETYIYEVDLFMFNRMEGSDLMNKNLSTVLGSEVEH